jgi:Ca2+-binding EF-hand superfamily protein
LTCVLSLAILKINEEALKQARDDMDFTDILKKYFATLDKPLRPDSPIEHLRKITSFEQLILVATEDFPTITNDLINAMRKTQQSKVIHNIEDLNKRTRIRSLTNTGRFSREELETIYDCYHRVLFYKHDSDESEPTMDFPMFLEFLASITRWCQGKEDLGEDGLDDTIVSPNSRRIRRKSTPTYHFTKRLFDHFVSPDAEKLTFQNIVTFLSVILKGDLMSRIELFFRLHDADQDGYMDKQDIVNFTDSLLYLFRFERNHHYLRSISMFLNHANEYADKTEDGDPDNIMLSLPSLRLVILSDETLERFFDQGFAASFDIHQAVVDKRRSRAFDIFDSLWANCNEEAHTDISLVDNDSNDEQSLNEPQETESFPELKEGRGGGPPPVQQNRRGKGRQRSVSSAVDLGIGRYTLSNASNTSLASGFFSRARGASFSTRSVVATPLVSAQNSPPHSPTSIRSSSASLKGFQLFASLRRSQNSRRNAGSLVTIPLNNTPTQPSSTLTHGSDETATSEDSICTPDNMSTLEEHVGELEESDPLDMNKMLDELDAVDTSSHSNLLLA